MIDFTFFIKRDERYHFKTSAEIIAVKTGEKGYYPILTKLSLSDLNKGELSEDVAEAALIGSMFGWEVPGARAAIDYATNKLKEGDEE